MSKCIAYVDGSYRDGVFGSGGVILDENKNELYRICQSGTDPEWASMQNVAGEVIAAMLAVKWAIANGYNHIHFYHDYIGIQKWTLPKSQGGWNATKTCTKAYKTFMEVARRNYNLIYAFTWVKGHSGDYWNSEADKLASAAIERSVLEC